MFEALKEGDHPRVKGRIRGNGYWLLWRAPDAVGERRMGVEGVLTKAGSNGRD